MPYVAEFLAAFPERLDNAGGEDAGLLSVGQALRVALARALMRTRTFFCLRSSAPVLMSAASGW